MSDTPSTTEAFNELAGQQALAQADAASQAPPAQTAAEEQISLEAARKLRSENQSLRARARAVADLNPDDYEALNPFLDALNRGDGEVVETWIEQQYNALQAARQAKNGGQQAPPPMEQGRATEGQILTAEDVVKLLDQRDRQIAEANARNAAVASINAEFQALGIDPSSATARAVAAKGMELSREKGYGVPVAEAWDAFRRDIQPLLTPQQQQTSGTPLGVPPAPNGVPGTEDRFKSMSPSDRIKARLADFQANG